MVRHGIPLKKCLSHPQLLLILTMLSISFSLSLFLFLFFLAVRENLRGRAVFSPTAPSWIQAKACIPIFLLYRALCKSLQRSSLNKSERKKKSLKVALSTILPKCRKKVAFHSPELFLFIIYFIYLFIYLFNLFFKCVNIPLI